MKGVAEILGLSRGLGAPPDDADFFDALEGLGEEGEQIPPPSNDGFFGVGEVDAFGLEDVRGEGASVVGAKGQKMRYRDRGAKVERARRAF